MKQLLQISNLAITAITIFANYWLNTASFNGKNVGSVSASYPNLFTPSGYAFAIWGLIYLAIAAFAVYQARDLFSKKHLTDALVAQVGVWYIVANVCNILWLYVWLNEWVGLSLLCMIGLFSALLIIVLRTRTALYDADYPTIQFVWWPFSLYFGWVTVAAVANITIFFTWLGWEGSPLGAVTTTLIVIALTVGVYLFMIWARNMRLYALVGIWALTAIAARHIGQYPEIAWVALAGAALIFINTGIHAWKNRSTLPHKKLKQALDAKA